MKTFDQIMNSLAWLSAGIIGFLMLSISFDVGARYLLNRPIAWVMEISGYSLLFLTLLSSAWLLKREGHVKIDIVPNLLDSGNRALLNIITSIFCAISCLLVSCFAIRAAWSDFHLGYCLPTLLKFPTFPLHIIVFIGFLLLSIQFLRRAYIYILARKETKAWNGG